MDVFSCLFSPDCLVLCLGWSVLCALYFGMTILCRRINDDLPNPLLSAPDSNPPLLVNSDRIPHHLNGVSRSSRTSSSIDGGASPSYGHSPPDWVRNGPDDGEDGPKGEEWPPYLTSSSSSPSTVYPSSGVRIRCPASGSPQGVRWNGGWVPGIPITAGAVPGYLRLTPSGEESVSILISCLMGRAL